jgi:peptide/nickel transport system ATP-binding protein
MILQDPKFSLNPVMTIGARSWRRCGRTKRSARGGPRARSRHARRRADRDPKRVYDLYPHEVSGGMGQRVMIAMMLIAEPELLIADEPTSALDVTVQLAGAAHSRRLVIDRGMGLIFISHDLRLVSSFCDRVLVMYAGKIVEELQGLGTRNAQHPYTQGLLA